MTWKVSTDQEINMEMLTDCLEVQMNLNTVTIMKVENMSNHFLVVDVNTAKEPIHNGTDLKTKLTM